MPRPRSRGSTSPRVRDRPLRWIWQESPAFQRFRGTDWLPEPCRSCALKEVDFGGCRCQAMALAGDAAATDPACELSPLHAAMFTRRARGIGGRAAAVRLPSPAQGSPDRCSRAARQFRPRLADRPTWSLCEVEGAAGRVLRDPASLSWRQGAPNADHEIQAATLQSGWQVAAPGQGSGGPLARRRPYRRPGRVSRDRRGARWLYRNRAQRHVGDELPLPELARADLAMAPAAAVDHHRDGAAGDAGFDRRRSPGRWSWPPRGSTSVPGTRSRHGSIRPTTCRRHSRRRSHRSTEPDRRMHRSVTCLLLRASPAVRY